MAPERVGPAVASRPLSLEIAALEEKLCGRSMPLRGVLEALQGRAYELLMILLVLPFAVPVSVPGMSTPFGLVIACIAAQLAVARLPWLPRRLLDAKIPAGFMGKVLAATRGVVRVLEKMLRSRIPQLTRSRRVIGFHLAAVVVAALLLALPLPIPFTNMIPAWAILLIALGLMERDGLFIAAGHGALVMSIAYFSLLGGSVLQSVHWITDWLAK